MESVTVTIRNPKVRKLLEDLEAMDLIEIKNRNEYKKEFLNLVKQLRTRNKDITPEDIAREVELVRKKKN